MAKKKPETGKMELLETSLYSIGAGAIMAAFTPMFPAALKWGLTACVSGIAGVVYYYSKKSVLDRVFENCDLFFDRAYPMLIKTKKTANSIIYTYTLPAGLSLQDFLNKQEAIENYLGRRVEIKYTFKAIQVEAFEPQTSYTIPFTWSLTFGTRVQIGYTTTGRLETLDIDKAPHLLIAGATGGGKSTLIRVIITCLMLSPSKPLLHLVDLKNGAEFSIFEKSDRVVSFSKTKQEAYKTLKYVLNEVERRYKLFYAEGVKDIEQYNKSRRTKLERQIVIIDEYADLRDQQETTDLVDSVAQKARACGIHLIISTQRPDAKVLDGNIKNNIPTIVGLKTANSTSSRVILDENGLEKLRGNGDLIFRHQGTDTRLQAPLLSPEGAVELIKHTYTNKPRAIIYEEDDEDCEVYI